MYEVAFFVGAKGEGVHAYLNVGDIRSKWFGICPAILYES